MSNTKITQNVERKKVFAIASLLTMSVVIILSGAIFSIYSLINNVSFKVLTSNVHGAIFGLVVLYLGIRYYFSVQKLKAEVYKATSKFSWSNFKKEKVRNKVVKSR